MSKKKRKGRKKKESVPPVPRPPADEPIAEWLKRQAKYRRAAEEFRKRNGITLDNPEGVEAEPLPGSMSCQEIDEELNELLDQDWE